MKDITKKYTNGEVTVVWKPETCIHSTVCWKGLVNVFDPRKKPWVNISGADTETIISQVKKCPSGALSYYMNNEVETETAAVDIETIIEVSQNGPLLVYGFLPLRPVFQQTLL